MVVGQSLSKFSANLGFLWTELPLPLAIRAAKAAGFAAVECHWPYDVPVHEVKNALAETELPLLAPNTRRGNGAAGEIGLAALPGREAEARQTIDEAITYAAAVAARRVHVMAGKAQGPAAHDTFVSNLHHACSQAKPLGVQILIEPLNAFDAPGYFLRTTDQARGIIEEVAADNIAMMFDCYHVQRTEGDIVGRFEKHLPVIGHVQFAAVPDRGPPDHGEVDYAVVFAAIAALGYSSPLGAEYKPVGATVDSLGWMEHLRY